MQLILVLLALLLVAAQQSQGVTLAVQGPSFTGWVTPSTRNIAHPCGKIGSGCLVDYQCISVDDGRRAVCEPNDAYNCGTNKYCLKSVGSCPASPNQATCVPNGYPIACGSNLFCPQNAVCLMREEDSRMVCVSPDDALAVDIKPVEEAGCDGIFEMPVGSLAEVANDRSSIMAKFNYSFAGSVSVPSVTQCRSAVVNRYRLLVPRHGVYQFSFQTQGCQSPQMMISTNASCFGPDSSSLVPCTNPSQTFSLPRSHVIFHVGAAGTLRCMQGARISISVQYTPAGLRSMIGPYQWLYLSIPCFFVLAVIWIKIFGMRSDMSWVWFCSACELSGNLAYVILTDFDSTSLFVSMVLFFFVPLIVFAIAEKEWTIEIIWRRHVTPLPIPWQTSPPIELQPFGESLLRYDHTFEELWRLPAYLALVLCRVLGRSTIILVFVLSKFTRVAIQMAVRLFNLVYLAVAMLIRSLLFIVMVSTTNPSGFLLVFVDGMSIKTRSTDIRQIIRTVNMLILLSVLFRTIPHILIVLSNGLSTGFTSDTEFTLALVGSFLTLASEAYYVAYLGLRRGKRCYGWNQFIGNDRFKMDPTSDTNVEDNTTANLIETPSARQEAVAQSNRDMEMSKLPPKKKLDTDDLEEPSWMNPKGSRSNVYTQLETTSSDMTTAYAVGSYARAVPIESHAQLDSASSDMKTVYAEGSYALERHECKICFAEDNRMQALRNCGHILCADCVATLKHNNKRIIICPFCKKESVSAMDVFV